MMNSIWYFWIGLVGMLLYGSVPAWGQLSPGKLSRVHQQLEGLRNCTRCHEVGKKLSPQKCLDCHRLLRQRIEAGKGLHAHPEYRSCERCHVDHQGLDFPLIHWKDGMERLDHTLTGFPLEGKHARLKCRECHQPKYIQNPEIFEQAGKDLRRTFLGLTADCSQCHTDVHRGELGNDCSRCHDPRAWSPAPGFDHQQTRFPLTGKHQQVDCARCHPTEEAEPSLTSGKYRKFVGLAFASCGDCHRDVHRGKLGSQCASCHSTRGWNQVALARFDHDQTGFPLKGKHRELSCQQCHPPGKSFAGLPHQFCADCHDNPHRGEMSPTRLRWDCSRCHTESSFQTSQFSVEDHQATRFPLEGAHLAVPCRVCHSLVERENRRQTVQFRFEPLDCQGCHSHPHGQTIPARFQGKDCKACHGVVDWHVTTFDHAKTNFPLEGRHQSVPCGACHRSLMSEDGRGHVPLAGISSRCQDCHPDVHQRQFAERAINEKEGALQTDCRRCHTPEDWTARLFDHNRDSRFPLEGAHLRVACQACHPQEREGNVIFTRYRPMDVACRACHGSSLNKEAQESTGKGSS
ncbi:MAG: hypothetical protein GXO78_01715 [Calditrichaeota bacterium]|nr:hypothetical protein [Calditrichota bacterium]